MQCKRNDPGLDECLKNATQSSILHLVKGKILVQTYSFFSKFIFDR